MPSLRNPLLEEAERGLSAAIDTLLERYSVEPRLPRPEVYLDMKARTSRYEPRSNTVAYANGAISRWTHGEEAGHWLYFAANPDLDIVGFDPSSDDLGLRALHELMGRYAANIVTQGEPAALTGDYSHYDEEHRAGYLAADSIWRGLGDALYLDLLLAPLDEAFALIDPWMP